MKAVSNPVRNGLMAAPPFANDALGIEHNAIRLLASTIKSQRIDHGSSLFASPLKPHS